MHILMSIAILLAVVAIVLTALLRVIRDLLVRGPYEAPLIEDDGLSWPPRAQDAATGSPRSTPSIRREADLGSPRSGGGHPASSQ